MAHKIASALILLALILQECGGTSILMDPFPSCSLIFYFLNLSSSSSIHTRAGKDPAVSPTFFDTNYIIKVTLLYIFTSAPLKGGSDFHHKMYFGKDCFWRHTCPFTLQGKMFWQMNSLSCDLFLVFLLFFFTIFH